MAASSKSGPSGAAPPPTNERRAISLRFDRSTDQFRFLLGDSRLGIGDLHVEPALGVDRVVVLLTELSRTLFEALELIDDVFDLLLLLVDRLRLRDRRGHGGNEKRHGNGDRDDTEKLLHSYEGTA